jgi:monothiol glutaredoxin
MEKKLKEQIEKLIKSSKVFLFMKGTPESPMCGFSAKSAEILKEHGINFKSFDVLKDNLIRQGVKEYSKWPTIPQLYVKGKFLGGSEILVEMAEKGELQKLL